MYYPIPKLKKTEKWRWKKCAMCYNYHFHINESAFLEWFHCEKTFSNNIQSIGCFLSLSTSISDQLWAVSFDWMKIFWFCFLSDHVVGLKIHWCENGDYPTILPEVDFFFFISHLHFQEFLEFSLLDNIPLTNIFSTSTKLQSNSNPTKN